MLLINAKDGTQPINEENDMTDIRELRELAKYCGWTGNGAVVDRIVQLIVNRYQLTPDGAKSMLLAAADTLRSELEGEQS